MKRFAYLFVAACALLAVAAPSGLTSGKPDAVEFSVSAFFLAHDTGSTTGPNVHDTVSYVGLGSPLGFQTAVTLDRTFNQTAGRGHVSGYLIAEGPDHNWAGSLQGALTESGARGSVQLVLNGETSGFGLEGRRFVGTWSIEGGVAVGDPVTISFSGRVIQ